MSEPLSSDEHDATLDTVGNNDSLAGEADDAQGANSVPTDGDGVTLDTLATDHANAMPLGFDPSLHAIGQDGKPIVKGDGTLAKKRGRKPGQKASPVSAAAPYALPPKDAVLGDDAVSTPTGSDNKLIAKWSANVLFNSGSILFGPEIGEPTKDEKTIIPKAFEDYYDVKGAPNIPPEIGLLIAVSAYAAPRIMHKEMEQKRRTFFEWVKSFFRKGGKKAAVADTDNNDATKVDPVNPPAKGPMKWAAN